MWCGAYGHLDSLEGRPAAAAFRSRVDERLLAGRVAPPGGPPRAAGAGCGGAGAPRAWRSLVRRATCLRHSGKPDTALAGATPVRARTSARASRKEVGVAWAATSSLWNTCSTPVFRGVKWRGRR